MKRSIIICLVAVMCLFCTRVGYSEDDIYSSGGKATGGGSTAMGDGPAIGGDAGGGDATID